MALSAPVFGRRKKSLSPGRRTAALAVAAGVAFAAAAAGEVGRVWRRGSAPLPRETDDLVTAAEEAVAETVEVAKAGYQEGSTRENALFNMLGSFVATFGLARTLTWLLRTRRHVGPFRNLKVGRRHIHHFVPGIVLAFAAGGVAIVSRDESIEPKLAFLFGTGMGMTLDESALLLELEDVYWSPEGLLSVEIALSVTAALASVAIALRFFRRGERAVLDYADALAAAEAAR